MSTESDRILDKTDVLVIGGGIVGCAALHYLARRGVDAVLVERGQLSREGSGTNAGSIHLQLWPKEADRPRPALEQFVRAKIEAGQVWKTLEQDLGQSLGVKSQGGLLVAETAAEFAAAAQLVDLQRSLGLDVQLLGANEVLSLAPSLTPDLYGAVYSPDEGSGNTLLVAPAFARSAMVRGARIHTDAAVRSIEGDTCTGFVVSTQAGKIRARRIVIATGPWTNDITAMIGVQLPVAGRRLIVTVTERAAPALDYMVAPMGSGLTLKQTSEGSYLIGGAWPAGQDLVGGRWSVEQDSLEGNLGVALRLCPALAPVSILRSWSGVIAHVGHNEESKLQFLGGLRPGIFVATGRGLFTMGPLFGRLLSELLVDGRSSVPINVFSPGP